MAIFLDHVNKVLGMLRADPITALSTDTSTVAFRTQLAVQRAIAKVWNSKQWSFKQRKTTLSVASGEDEIELPKDVGEPYMILSSLEPYILTSIDEDDFDRLEPNPQESASPKVIMLFEQEGVNTQLSAASTVTAVSSSSADITQKVLVKGIVSGEVDYEELSLIGTTSVTTSKSFTKITSVTKSDITSGRVTITDSGAVTLLVMSPLEKVIRLRKARLYPDPSASLTVTIKHFALPRIPVHAYEDSEIPSRWNYVVEQYAFAMALQPQGQDQINEQIAQFNLANAFMGDMAKEEKQSSMQIIQPAKAFDVGEGNGGLFSPPSGWNYTNED